MKSPPVILCLGGHDPTGGAGISADIQTAAALGVHAATVVTALTVQDTSGVFRVDPVAPDMLLEQAKALLNDLPVAAIKTGLLPTADSVRQVAELLGEYASLPLIVDPVLAPGGQGELLTEATESTLRQLLLPRATLATPNTLELARLAGTDDTDRAVAVWLETGCRHLLLTGTHDATPQVVHRLYAAAGEIARFEQARLPHDYHGSGCTLASACAAGLAAGLALDAAVAQALRYTEHSLRRGFAPGHGQWLPNRLKLPDTNEQ